MPIHCAGDGDLLGYRSASAGRYIHDSDCDVSLPRDFGDAARFSHSSIRIEF